VIVVDLGAMAAGCLVGYIILNAHQILIQIHLLNGMGTALCKIDSPSGDFYI